LTEPVESARIVDLGHSVHQVDTLMSGYSGITSAFLIRDERPCLIETGTATSAHIVRDALSQLGIGPRDLETIVVTHIHLDHAGGVGDLAGMFPKANIVVHELGARHLTDPTRLLTSARRVFGSVLDDVFGVLTPTESDRIIPIGERGAVELGGGRRLELFHAPGHAQHHLGMIDSVSGDLYVWDAAGIYIPDTDTVRPATPPPDFDLDLALASLRRFRDATPTRLLFSHFGAVGEVEETLSRSEVELQLWVEIVRDARREAPDTDHALEMVRQRTADRYRDFLADDELQEKFGHLNADVSNVVGINRWLDRVDSKSH